MRTKQNVTLYYCEHCKRAPYQRKGACERHEKMCNANPANNRACFGCRYLTKKETSEFIDYGYGEDERKVNLLYCSKLDAFRYPPSVQHKKNWIEVETANDFNQPMPVTCAHRSEGVHTDDLPF